MSYLVSHPTANTNTKAVISGMYNNNELAAFFTTLALFPGSLGYKLGNNINQLKELHRRAFPPEWEPFTKSRPYMELGRLFASKFGLEYLVAHEKGCFCVDNMYHTHDKWVASNLSKYKNLSGVYAYEDGALQTFNKAKELGIQCVYDLPIAYWETGRALMQNAAKKLPEWALTLKGGIKDSELKLERKVQELKLADTVVVASDFVRNSLPEWAADKKIIQSPFGTPKNNFKPKFKIPNKKLRVLFVGSMTQRKGLGDLFNAMKLIDSDKVELVVLGSLVAPMSFYKSFNVDFTYETTRPHKEVLALMQSCDVFCLPSIVEGRALVMQEAMSQGLPIIITPNTGGEDLVETGKTGFLVPTHSPAKIAEKIEWFVNHSNEIVKMGKASKEKAMTYSWEKYALKIVQELK
jgi:glycosyltransferase involved in cell wall biosynthesis